MHFSVYPTWSHRDRLKRRGPTLNMATLTLIRALPLLGKSGLTWGCTMLNARRLLVDTDALDMLMQVYDLPPHNPDYFDPMAKDVCLKTYPKYMLVNDPDSDLRSSTEPKDIGRRAVAILPLLIGEIQAIPIPFIYITGAPDYLYMSYKAWIIMDSLHLIKEVSGRHAWHLRGTLLGANGAQLPQPPAAHLPAIHQAPVGGDERLNILGLKALMGLDLIRFNY